MCAVGFDRIDDGRLWASPLFSFNCVLLTTTILVFLAEPDAHFLAAEVPGLELEHRAVYTFDDYRVFMIIWHFSDPTFLITYTI